MRGPISIAVTGLIGLTTEAIAAHKDKKNGHVAHDDDEEQAWMCDDVQDQLDSVNMSHTGIDEHSKIFDSDGAPPPSFSQVTGRLPAAVIIPQRRPHSKTRGFVRAYAPDLGNCGINQQVFMHFLAGFDAAIQKQSLFFVANLPVAGGVLAATMMMGSNPLVDLAGILVHATLEAGRRMYVTHKTNDYLFDMNEKLFKPRGLYALIMTYNPDSSNAYEVIDVDAVTAKAVAVQEHGGTGSKFSSAAGATNGEAEMPEAVPLTFPYLEFAGHEQKQNAFNKAKAFVGDYGDRRAQAKFEAAHPDSILNITPKKEFSSRFADPNHPVNKGGPLCVLTGGAISKDNKKRERKEREAKEDIAAGRQPKSNGGLKKKLLSEHVLYLMIVNMPTDEQLHAVAEAEKWTTLSRGRH
ncbi:hypothetical protein LTR10_017116 [Elasticomyces elasticus]|uniref:Uncharacterized protein n=1 Tax=Exophiala sideris TaxID=1016849 RepID=A0ABR0JDW5_9EURO|nr:hypothetical protein LTR10_017116 [Elasticomyces elasticus]KAK5032587.1 hypothetical protein LTS07_003996 [Exophiala sideris]KAK5037233.1 hypothetical protein LTR13_005039 [Exophiala sideris]KAK5062112.1 hypothetical protein LTR69_004469 [Exophiala sideris]KAK5182391.1 hypothetical protein LTR44_005403 [Eurotiomycetes sp. CCFEE 6388]